MSTPLVEVDPRAAWDEVFSAPGTPEPIYRDVMDEIQRYEEGELRTRFHQLSRIFRERGVTFALGGEECPFPLDLIPRIISAMEWDTLAAGIRQRVLALEDFLSDIYQHGNCFDDGVIPKGLVTGVPARYVSGYLHPSPDAAIGETGAGQSHAWIEYFAGEWVGIDPTSGNDIGLSHVAVAKGRDYSDIPPLKGIYHGAPSRALGVTGRSPNWVDQAPPGRNAVRSAYERTKC